MTATVPPSTGSSDLDQTDDRHRKVVIIGSGPAGLTAAIYAARANLEPLVIAGNVPMGQLMITSDVENYPGFPQGIQGPELMQHFRDQAERFGSTIVERDATKVDFSQRPFRIWVGEAEYRADTVIVATGASAIWLGIPSEEEFRGRGVSACATCDGFFFRGREVAVVGGGDTALEEATFLTRFADKVTMLVRRDEFRGSAIMQERAERDPKIEILFNKEVTEIKGEMTVNALALRDTATGETSELGVQGMFVAIGYKPNTDLFEGQLRVGKGGYLEIVGETGSGIDGVFVAGDVHDSHYRQAVTAAGDGCKRRSTPSAGLRRSARSRHRRPPTGDGGRPMVSGAIGVGRRLVHWLLGVPRPDELEEHVRHASERDHAKTGAIVEASRSNMSGGKGTGPGPQGWQG